MKLLKSISKTLRRQVKEAKANNVQVTSQTVLDDKLRNDASHLDLSTSL